MTSVPVTTKPVDTRGLAGLSAGDTSVCSVNQTQLIYRGYEIADLAANATFEEVSYLLLVGEKPSADELATFDAELKAERAIPTVVQSEIIRIANENPDAHPMSVLRTAVSLLSHLDPDCEDNSPAAGIRKAKRLLAKIPTCIGTHQMALDGKTPVEPDSSLSHAANLLWCMSGEKPGEIAAKVVDVSLILYAEHDFNASTFTTRVIASTNSDMHSAVCGGIGALKGNLHGGANEAAMDMLRDIMTDTQDGEMTTAEWMQRAFTEKRKLMGFGHRVYKNYDPRAAIVKKTAYEVLEALNVKDPLLDIALQLEAVALEDPFFIERKLYPNVDFYTGLIYKAMGFPTRMFTVLFALGRLPGWIAQWREMIEDPTTKIGRPRQVYTGAIERNYPTG